MGEISVLKDTLTNEKSILVNQQYTGELRAICQGYNVYKYQKFADFIY